MNLFAIVSVFLLTVFTAFGDLFLKKAGELKNNNYTYLA